MLHFISQLLISAIIMSMGFLWLCIVAVVAALCPNPVFGGAFALVLIALSVIVAFGSLYEEITNRKGN